MRNGCAITAIAVTGLMIYGLGAVRDRMPSGKNLKESINKIKEFRSSPSLSAQRPDGEESFSHNQEYRDFLKEEGVEIEIKSPIIEKMLNVFEGHKTGEGFAAGIYFKYFKFSRIHVKWGNYYILIAILLAVSGILLSNSGSYSLAALTGRFVFFGGRFMLFTAASAAIIFWVLIGKNLWMDAGINLFLGPLELIGGSIIILKVYDPNYPVFGRVVFSMMLPAVSAIIFAVG